jgi:hypothetical protein
MHRFLNLLSDKLRITAALSLFCLITLLTSNVFATDRYVAPAPTGNDNNNGLSSSSPYASIQKAHDAASAGDKIIVAAGTYREQVNITKDNLTFQASGTVTINGTDLIGNPSNSGNLWTAAAGKTFKINVTGTPWRDLYSPRDVMTNDYYYDYGDKDPTHKGFGENQLFLDTTMIQQLRWPHNTSTDVAMPTMARVKSVTAEEKSGPRNDAGTVTFTGRTTVEVDGFSGDTRWIGAYIFINTGHNGADGNGLVRKVTNVGPNSITFDYYRAGREGPFTIGGPNAEGGLGTELYLFNPDPARLPSDSDVNALLGPGEWYKKGNTLYVKTFDQNIPNTTLARNVNSKTRYFAFAGNGTASGYTVDGFSLFACSVTTFTGQEDDSFGTPTSSCSNITFNNLNIRYVSHQVLTQDDQQGHNGWTGIVLNGSDHTVSNCTINYSATSAISLQGNRHKCFGNKIYNTNYMVSNASAINCGRRSWSEDLKIADNVISNTTYCGIYMANLRNSNVNSRGLARISGNTIVNFMRRTGDSGAIDIAGTDMQWARIDHNYIYNTINDRYVSYEGAQIFGIYFDFGAGGTGLIRAVVDHNVITNLMLPVLINSGSEVEVFNNVLIGNGSTAADNGKYSIANGTGGTGAGVRIFNNIMSHPRNAGLSQATYQNNIDDATVANVSAGGKYAGIFVAPKFTGTSRSIDDFKLSGNQIAKDFVVDKGDLSLYNGANVNGLDAVQGPPDRGAFEWGTLLSSPDVTKPTTPPNFSSTSSDYRSITLTWGASTDAGGLSYYYLTSSPDLGAQRISADKPLTFTFDNLPPSTTYTFTLVAYDVSGNISEAATRTVTTGPKTADVVIPKSTAATTLTIDGTKDAAYSLTPIALAKKPDGTAYTASANFGANWTATWDATNLYIHVAVTDNIRVVDKTKLWYNNDGVEILINGNGNRPTSYGTNDYQFFITAGDTVGQYSKTINKTVKVPNGVLGKTVDVNSTSYNAEFQIPFSVLGISTPAELTTYFGIDVNVLDVDGGTTTNTKIVWKSEAYQNLYNTGLAQLGAAPAISTLRNPENPASTAAGLDYKYFEGSWGNLPNFDALTPVKQGNVTNFDLTPRNVNDYFGFKFSGYVNVPTDGTYTFYTTSDDGSKLYIGSTEVVSNDGSHAPLERSGTIGLKAGKHAITVVFFEAAGGESLTVSYSGPGLSKQAIPASALFRTATTGTVTMERWDNISGLSISNIPLTTTPTSTSTLTSLEIPVNAAENYGVRIRGYIVPTTTADYYFYIASDDNGELWLSSNDQPVNKSTSTYIANVPSWTNSREWTKFSSQKSTVKNLQAGTRYYFEALMKEGGGGDNLAIGWTTATNNTGITVIGGSNIAPYCSTCRTANAERSLQVESLSLKLYPNPANNDVSIDLSGFEGESAVQVKMSDMTGKLFVGQQVQMEAGVKQVTLPVSHLPQGLFFVTVQGSKVARTAKLVIAK